MNIYSVYIVQTNEKILSSFTLKIKEKELQNIGVGYSMTSGCTNKCIFKKLISFRLLSILFRAVGRSENPGGDVVGIICPRPLVEIELTYLSKTGGVDVP